jgi:hypothetical protein
MTGNNHWVSTKHNLGILQPMDKQLLRNADYLIHQGASEWGLVSLMEQQLFQPGIDGSIFQTSRVTRRTH